MCLGTVCAVVPLLPAVCGVRGWASVSACLWDVYGCVRAPLAPRRFRFRCAVWACLLGFGFWLRPASPWGVVGGGVCSCARPAWSPAPPGWGCCAGVRVCARAQLVPRLSWLGCGVWACVLGPGLGCAPPFLVGLSGCVFCAFLLFGACLGLALWCRLLAVPVPGPVVPVALSPFFRAGLLALFFFFQRGVCLHVSVSLFQVGRCFWLGAASFGLVVPLCLFGGPVFGGFRMGGLAASCGVGGQFGGCGLFSRPPPSPPCSFFCGRACLFLPLPSLGWRTHWPAFSVVFRAAVGGCVLLGRVPAPWVGWAMDTLGSAPLPAGLGPGSAGWAAAPGGCVWLWVMGLGLSVSFLLCGASFNLLGGPPPLLPGARWPRVWPAVPVCGVLVRRLSGCAVACVG